MPPRLIGIHVVAACPTCGSMGSTFEARHDASDFGEIVRAIDESIGLDHYNAACYRLLRCATYGRGALATIFTGARARNLLRDFYPRSVERAPLPDGVPKGIVNEVREAEVCASVNAWRAGSALLRSALEKTLGENGYVEGRLIDKIDAAAKDTVITAARQRSAHDDIRVLGNDILHDAWRVVTPDEYAAAHHYIQRIIEDFYDRRAEVESVLRAAKRLPEATGGGLSR